MIEGEIPRGFASEINELKKTFEYGEKEDSLAYLEKCSTQLTNILEKSIAIIDEKGGEYSFNPKIYTKSETQITISEEKIDTTFSTAYLVLETTGIQNDNKRETTSIHIQEEEKNMLIKTLLLGKTLYDTIPFEEIYVQNSQSYLQETIAKEMIEKRGNDATRLCRIQEASGERKWKGKEAELYE
ncbi:MAG: hypothetical protein WCJ39_05825 [bacterium]